jgi:hypothetical protein
MGDLSSARNASTARRRRRSPRAAATVTAPSRPIATTPSSGTLKGRDPGTAAGEAEGLGDPLGFREARAVSEPVGEPLGLVIVVPNGVGEIPGETELAGCGVAVAGRGVGRGVGLAVGTGVGTGVGGGVGAVTTTGAVGPNVGLVPPLLTELNVTGQLPTGKVDEPVQVPFRGVPVRESAIVCPATDAVTVMPSSVAVPTKCTENWNAVAVVPVVGVTIPPVSFAAAAAALAGIARFSTASASNNHGV